MVYIEIDGFIYNEIDKLDVAAWSAISVEKSNAQKSNYNRPLSSSCTLALWTADFNPLNAISLYTSAANRWASEASNVRCFASHLPPGGRARCSRVLSYSVPIASNSRLCALIRSMSLVSALKCQSSNAASAFGRIQAAKMKEKLELRKFGSTSWKYAYRKIMAERVEFSITVFWDMFIIRSCKYNISYSHLISF